MADNTQLGVAAGGDSIRTLDKTGTGAPKTEVVGLDLGGGDGRGEFIASFPLPVTSDAPVDDDNIPLLSLSPSSMDAIEMLFRQTIATAQVAPPYFPVIAAETSAGVTIVQSQYPPMTVDRYGVNTLPGTTDMLAAINAAIKVTSYTDNGGGGTVDFLASIYFHSAEIPLVKYVRLRGVSEIGTLLLSTHTGNGVISIWTVNSSTAVYEQIENLTLKNTNAANTGAGFVDVCGTYINLSRVKVQGFKFGVILDQSELVDLDFCDLQFNLTAGLWMTNGADYTPSLTFTAGPAIGATSGTLTGNWTGFTGTYHIAFVETVGGAVENRTGTLTNGSTAVIWTGGLGSACNAATTGASVGFTNRIAVYGCAFNQAVGTGTAILDDGGNDHTIQNCNVSGFGTQYRSCGGVNLNLIGGLWSLGNAACFNFATTSSNLGTTIAKSFAVNIDGVQFGPASGQAAINVSGGLGQTAIKNCFFSTTVTPIVNAGAITALDAFGNSMSTPAQGLFDTSPVNAIVSGTSQTLAADAALATCGIYQRQLKVLPIAGQSTALLGGSAGVFGGDIVINRGGNNYLEVCNATKSILFGADSGTPFFGTYSNHEFDLRTNNTTRIAVAAAGNVTVNAPTSGAALTLAAGTTGIEPLLLTSGTNLTTPVAGAVEYDGTVKYFSPAASSRAVDLFEYLCILNGAFTLVSQTGAQFMFNSTAAGAVTLPIGTYEFECQFSLTALSATSGAFGFALAGGATFTQAWWALANKATLATASAPQMTFNTAANVLIAAATTATVGYAKISGVIRVTVAGTVIPQLSQTTAAAAVVGINSFFRCRPVGSATVTTVGNWS